MADPLQELLAVVRDVVEDYRDQNLFPVIRDSLERLTAALRKYDATQDVGERDG